MVTRFCLFVLVLTFGLSSAAVAAQPFWHSALIATDNDNLQSVSCSTPTLCIGVGDNGIAAVEDGSYEYLTIADQDANLPSLNSISCVPGARFCMAVDSRGQAVPWVDGEFGTLTNVAGNHVLESVSCPTTTFCKAVDDFGKVYTYTGTWSSTSFQLTGTIAQGTPRLSCATQAFCVAVDQDSNAGFVYSKFTTATGWSSAAAVTGSAADEAPRSLVCTTTTFCLATSNKGSAARFDGSAWSVHQVVPTVRVPLFAGCAPGTTACQAIDQNVKGYSTTNGTTWSSGTALQGSTQLSSPSSVSCLAADLCVATSGMLASTFARTIIPTSKPVLSGTGTVGSTLTVTHPALDETRAWFGTIWWRCNNPGSTCVRIPDVLGPSYTLTAADQGTYVEARDDTGIGLDEEGSKFSGNMNFVSNTIFVAEPVTTQPPADTSSSGSSGGGAQTGTTPVTSSSTPMTTPATLTAAVKTSKTGITISVTCPGPGTCKGKIKLTFGKTALGAKTYKTASGKKVSVKITLGKAAKKLLKKHRTLKAKLTIVPAAGKTITKTVTLKR